MQIISLTLTYQKTKQNRTLQAEGQKDGVQQNLFGTYDDDDWWYVGLEGTSTRSFVSKAENRRLFLVYHEVLGSI